jgi:hypothetical protein
MTTSWHSIFISLPDVGPIFNGYFSVIDSTNKVTSFYETINGITDFNNNIFANNNYDLADNLFIINNNNFTYYGTNVNYMNYYNNPTSPGYDPYQYYTFWLDGDGNNAITQVSVNEAGVETDNIFFPANFTIQTISDPSCFNEGTKILCLNKNLEEEYILIENLRKGDLVKSYKHGYRKIDLIGKNLTINNPEKFNECMYKMEKTEENGLLDDLIVTGGHSILINDLTEYKEENDKIFGTTPMIDDKYLLLSAVSKEFIKLENTNLYTYYHFILENNGNDDERFGVWANGILTETPSKNYFINHKYTLL